MRGGRPGGGFVACRTGSCGVCLGGRLGDAVLGGRLGDAVRAGLSAPAPTRLTGGFGKLSVRRPVVSFLYGSGGGFGTSSSTSCSCLREGAGTGEPNPPCAGAAATALLALPPYAVCLGGGPNESGIA